MKHFIKSILLIVILSCFQVSGHAQIFELIRLVTSEVIKAMDLEVQKQQNQVLAMQVSQKMLENGLSENKLSEIEGWLQKQKDLYSEYYASLKKVNGVIQDYQKITAIISKQEVLSKLYNQTKQSILSDSKLDASTRSDLIKIMDELMAKGLDGIERLATALSKGAVSVSDGGRLAIIKNCFKELDMAYKDLSAISRSIQQSAYLKSQNDNDTKTIKKAYGL